MPPGYSGTPLPAKLGFRDDTRLLVIGAPGDYDDLVGPVPAGLQRQTRLSKATNLVHLFVTRRADLARQLARLRTASSAETPVWVSWPKKSSKVPTDVTEDVIRELALALGYVDIKVCAVSDTWSGLKLTVRKALRGQGDAGRSSPRSTARPARKAGVRQRAPTADAQRMRVVVLSADDAPQYRAVMLHAYEHAADAFTSTAEERAAEPHSWWVNRIASPASLTVGFGAFEQQLLTGVVALEYSAKPKTRHKALVVGMYVLPDHRGRGIARALMQAAIGHAGARGGITVLQLEATQGNDPATALYASLGFQAYGVEPMALLTPGGYRAKVHMWRPLAGVADAG